MFIQLGAVSSYSFCKIRRQQRQREPVELNGKEGKSMTQYKEKGVRSQAQKVQFLGQEISKSVISSVTRLIMANVDTAGFRYSRDH